MSAPPRPEIAFPGRDRMVAALDAAVAVGDGHQVTSALRRALCRLIRDPGIALPGCVFQPVRDHYARREIFRSPDLGYSVVAMTWGPGQGTPIHDHSGLWCVEGVWKGELEITQYELLERLGERFHFRAASGLVAGPGSAGSLIPPHEYHAIRNTSEDAVAISVHIYEAPMEACSMYAPQDGEWFARSDRTLARDIAG